MAYLDYYRQNPAWATSQWQSMRPPAPSFQPQPSWGGYDYFASTLGNMNVDSGLYNYGINSLRNMSSVSSYGVSMPDAKMQHRRAYGGLGDILVMGPQEIGAAAAYEVWRNWRYNNGVLAQPLAGDVARQREALVGLAIGESAKLWQYTRRIGDTAGQAAAAETAAICAARIFDQGNEVLMRTGGAYGSLGAGSLSGALSPVLGPTGGYGAGAYGNNNMPYDSIGAGLGAPSPISRRRSASFGGAYDAPIAAPGYAGSGDGLYGGADGMLGAGAGYGAGGGYGGAGLGYGGAGGGYGGSLSRPISPVLPSRPASSMGYAGAPNLSYAGSAIDDPMDDVNPIGGAINRRLGEHELHRSMRFAQRAELSALQGSRYGPGGGGLPIDGGSAYGGPAYGGYDGGYDGGYGPSRYGYDDIDGYGYGRRGRHGIGRRALEGGLEGARYARAGGGLGAGRYL